MCNEYFDHEQNAIEFAKKHNIKLCQIGEPKYKKHFADDTHFRYVFKMRLSRNGKSYTFNFGQSLAEGAKTPTMYEVLACLQKYDVGAYEDFIREFGYEYNKTSLKIYKAVVREYEAVERLFGDIIDELREIW